ncbi:MAG: ATP-dependent Clp protease ATP-binding subunit [Elusimicrobiales bacterium]|nr:ATP-dependent Clp protease ATP-binding subunit [Elusimicrobiales bacterium]
MMQGRFSPHFQRIFMIAQEHAKRLNHEYLGSEHILLAITDVEDSIAAVALKNLSVDLKKLRIEIEDAIGVGQSMMLLGEIPLSSQAKKIIEYAVEEAQRLGHNYIGSEHIILALVKDEEGIGARILGHMGVKYQNLRQEILKLLGETQGNIKKEDEEGEESFDEESTDEKPQRQYRESYKHSYKPMRVKTQTLDEFGRDLTELAKNDQLDPVIGRTSEMDRVIQVLGRRTKNNPVLVGEPGVGKTAIVEGLAQRIVSGDIPETLSGKRLVSLDLASIVAGTKYRGEFEQRLKTIIDEIRKAKNSIIIFIDELHTVIGAGAAEGAIDAANILKPALARGELQCIGATTFDEYRKHIEHDPALERRFQPVVVEPPSVEETITILKGLKEKYESHHMCIYDDKAIESAVVLSDRYITDRALPDKAIDLMDEAGSSVRLKMSVYPPEFKEKEKEIEELIKKEKEADESNDVEKKAELVEKRKQLKKDFEEMKRKWREEREKKRPVVSEEDIAIIASKWTGIPVTRMTQSEADKLLHMEEEIHKRIIGQDEAVKIISRSIKRSRTGMKDPKKPIGNFLFLGPTGVGKTELARAVAEYLFGNEDAMIRIDMSEYMEKFAVSRLIGAPPGYVGYEEGGKLTEAVRRKPYSVVVLDEMEKAHPDVYNILLQVMDDGILTDSLGHKVSFKNTILIMTSNIGARLISKGKTLGFVATEDKERDYKEMKDTVMDEVKRVFNPEFVNRIDEIVVFRPLTQDDIYRILDINFAKVQKKVADRNIILELTDKARDFVSKKGFDPNYGARPLLRTIQKYIEDPLSEFMLMNKVKDGSCIIIDYSDGDKLDINLGSLKKSNER